MKKAIIFNQHFEKDSLVIFEKLLQGYSNAIGSDAWEDRTDELIKKLTHCPTAAFERKLMNLFDYSYLVFYEDINTIIEKALLIREQMEDSKRYVFIKKKYYTLPFLPQNTFLKKLLIYNHEKELCYLQTNTLKFTFINFQKLCRHVFRSKKK